jgi:hypothetical protein
MLGTDCSLSRPPACALLVLGKSGDRPGNDDNDNHKSPPIRRFGRTKISDPNPDPTTVWTVYAARPLSTLLSCDGV